MTHRAEREPAAGCRRGAGCVGSVTPVSLLNLSGRKTKAATTTRISEITAEMKKPRLMAVMPLRSLSRGATTKMPTTAVMTPMPA